VETTLDDLRPETGVRPSPPSDTPHEETIGRFGSTLFQEPLPSAEFALPSTGDR